MNAYPTPHINAAPGDFAPVVLMPGDPKRARFIAENFLTGARLVNDVRGVQGYTGTYKGTPVSVMASGMGMPSMGIYSYELYHVFGVEVILRVGSCGAMQDGIRVRDIILGQGACTDSRFASQFRLPGDFAPLADFGLLTLAARTAEELKLPFHVGNLLSSDLFYKDEEGLAPADTAAARWAKMGVLAVEMESAALYMTAARAGKRALAICTVSDHLFTGEETTSEQRQTGFTDMMTLALESAAKVKI
ncbi:MAG: purine-nucleoside phosphorylase [Clostridia bacterium]|nr:purine-nucleoside phosphorylase [Clostridia bacterium]